MLSIYIYQILKIQSYYRVIQISRTIPNDENNEEVNKIMRTLTTITVSSTIDGEATTKIILIKREMNITVQRTDYT